ncbi:uncharacterized protein LOC134949797 [Pseudophryne corroboree]|uniref:uncharacterized protein LOC134949797 n=1 Tax=Pseudophryne corroboree TaxID=495146 RepID=UPI0030812021
MNNHSKAVCDIIHALLSKPDQVNELGQMLDSGRQSETGNQRPEMPVPRADLFPTSSTRSHGVENEVRSLFSRKSPQFHYTRSSVRKRNAYPAKATQSNVRGPLTFIKELILLSGPNIDNVLKQGKKQELHEVGHIVNAFEFNKYWSEEEVYENVRKAFSMKLEDDIEIHMLMPCHNKLVKPLLMENQRLTGLMISKIFKQKSVYIQPSKELIYTENSDQDNVSYLTYRSSIEQSEKLPEDTAKNCETFVNEDSILQFINQTVSPEDQVLSSVEELEKSVLSHNTPYEPSNLANSVTTQGTQNIVYQDNENTVSHLVPSTFEENYRHYTELFNDVLPHSDEDIACTEESLDHNQNTEWNSDINLKDILSNLAVQIDTESISKFNINRREVWDGACRGLKRQTFRPENRLSVIFTDSFGNTEGAVDFGGPTREFFRLLLQFLQISKLFEGPENSKTLSCDAQALRNDEYYLAGLSISLSLVHGGPAPNFFSPVLYNALTYGWKNTPLVLQDLVDVEAKEIMQKIMNATSVENLQDVLYENNLLLNLAGCLRVIKTVDDKHQIVQDYLHWYLRDRTMHSEERFKEGLKTLGVLDAMNAHPDLFKKAFIWKKDVMTSDVVSHLFKISYSPVGSNARIREERIICYWRDFILDCEERECRTKLQDILLFVTGVNHIPPIGLDPQPSIEFIDGSSNYPEANTCGNVLRLPFSKGYKEFKENLEFGILNSPGFGRP